MGGLTEARRIQKFAGEKGVYSWCGGMVDDGVARGHNMAVATLPYYRYPNDIQLPGTGFELNQEVVEKHTLEKWEFTK